MKRKHNNATKKADRPSTAKNQTQFMSIPMAAQTLGITPAIVRRLVRDGVLRSFSYGGKMHPLIVAESVAELLAKREAAR